VHPKEVVGVVAALDLDDPFVVAAVVVADAVLVVTGALASASVP